MQQTLVTPIQPQDKSFRFHLNKIQEDTIAALEDMAQQGDFIEISLPGPNSVYFINHPDYIREVLVTKASKFHKPTQVKLAAWGIFGYNMFTSDGDVWRALRKAVQPAFHSSRINSYAEIMVNDSNEMLDGWSDGQTVDIPEAMMTLTMGITTKALFDKDLRDEEAGKAIVRFIELFNKKASSTFPLPTWVPTPTNQEVKQLMKIRHDLLAPMIAEQRQSGEDRGDLLSMLLIAQREDDTGILTDEQVFNEISNLFAAGYEVVAHTTGFTLYLISQHPEVEQKLFEEIDRVLGGRRVTVDDLPQLPYLEMVAKESMRLLPATTMLARQAAEKTDISGQAINKNDAILLAPWTLHRRDDIFSDPLKFDPERFSPENEGNVPKHGYIPFSAGPRVCIGNAFAMLQIRVTLATMLQRYRFKTREGYEMEPFFQFNTRPKNGLPMILEVR